MGDAAADAGGGLEGLGEDFNNPVVASVVPQVLAEPERDNAAKNDISVRLTGRPAELAPGASATRSFTLFAGPKRPELLEKLGADDVMDLGWFGAIGTVMLWVMGAFHDWGAPYWLAIISLTVCVRICMLPMSWRAAVMASKQKALAPKLAEIKKKHGDDLQASGREQMALMRKHGVNPLLGCLPVFFTIPVFVALYNALLNSVDLRLAEFSVDRQPRRPGQPGRAADADPLHRVVPERAAGAAGGALVLPAEAVHAAGPEPGAGVAV